VIARKDEGPAEPPEQRAPIIHREPVEPRRPVGTRSGGGEG